MLIFLQIHEGMYATAFFLFSQHHQTILLSKNNTSTTTGFLSLYPCSLILTCWTDMDFVCEKDYKQTIINGFIHALYLGIKQLNTGKYLLHILLRINCIWQVTLEDLAQFSRANTVYTCSWNVCESDACMHRHFPNVQCTILSPHMTA